MMRLIASAAEFVCSVAKREVTRFGDRQRGLDRFQIAHFADEDDVGIFAQRVLERVREALGVRADFALVDDAALMAVDELDRIFDRDDVAAPLAIDLVDHRGERRATCPSPSVP